MGENMTDKSSSKKAAHWRKTRTLMIGTLILWFVFSFVVHWFANDLNNASFLHFPLGFYMAAQGSPFIFVVLIFASSWWQEKIDEEFGFAEEE